MKQFLIFVGFLIFIWACTTQKGIVKVEQNVATVSQPDSLEYDLETFDSKFKSWYDSNNNPAMYKTQEYYEYWNRQYVSAWNSHASEKNSTFLSLIHISEPTRRTPISYAVFCL